MLKEYLKARQNPQEPLRRIFSDDYFDLYVWYGEGGDILGFQLCYDYLEDGRVLSYLEGRYSHHGIDAGEASPLKNLSPILVADGVFPQAMVLERFLREAGALPQNVAEYVADKVRAFPTP